MTHRLLIVHGFTAGIDSHWFPWLAGEARAGGYAVHRVHLPDSSAPDPAAWHSATTAAFGEIDEETVVVAHSLGCLTSIRALAALPGRLGAAVFVSGFADKLPPLPQLDAFIGDGADLAAVTDRIDRVQVIRSDDDGYVPIELTDAFAARLGAPVTVVPGGGHFLASQGFTTLPAVLAHL
ncbi:serine hydrolase family protein [Microbacteriaceae bacterium VKM Ac-2855]|nr:serine hydrolase family protein [Microbacteriaceae bacterium VKM Ac-2855]